MTRLRTTALLVTLLLVSTAALGQDLQLRQIATVTSPVSIAHAGDGRLFILQQGGQVVIWDGNQILPTPFLNVAPFISAGGERGLLGIAFHPRYFENGFFYVNYTDTQGDTVIARYSVSRTDPNRADPTTGINILTIDQPFPNHNGGQLQFGPDGYLYIGMGDGGSAGDPGNRAQNLSDLLGKMLRIDVDAAVPYAVPAGNPFVNRSGARGEIWASGLRNPWRFSFDRANGDLWIADVGQGQREELNRQPGASRGGENYGWRRMEGTHCFNPGTNCNDGSLALPVIEYDHGGGACSVTGGYVYRGVRYPRLYGMYFFGDYCNGMIWGATPTPTGAYTARLLRDTTLLISTFGEDVNGEIYVADHRGGIYQLTDSVGAGPRRRAVGGH